MIGIILRIFFLMQRSNRVGDKVHIHDVDFVGRTKWKHRQSRQKHKCLHHLELGGFRVPAVTEYDAGTKNGEWNFRQKLPDHVLAKLLGSRIGIVIGTIPINGLIFPEDLIMALPRHRHRTDMTEAPQSVVMIRAHGKLHNLQGAPKIHIQTAFF